LVFGLKHSNTTSGDEFGILSCVYSLFVLVGTLLMRSMGDRSILTPRHKVNIIMLKIPICPPKKHFVLIRKTNSALQENNHHFFLEPFHTHIRYVNTPCVGEQSGTETAMWNVSN
jgi:hypothetical protein